MAFTAELYREFSVRVSGTLSEDLGYCHRTSAEIADTVMRLLVERGSAAYEDIHELLAERGIQHRWNGVFHHCRSAAIAQWILPHIRGSLIDLLSGSGRVGGILADLGVPTSLSERASVRNSYPVVETSVPLLEHDELTAQDSPRSYDTVLLSTALHHELDPERLLQLALGLASNRIIIIENCVETGISQDLHVLVDDFFNYCLNKTPLPCPAEHRRIEEWIDMLRGRAHPVFSDRRPSLPGIPLSHHLLVAEVVH